MTQMNNSAGLAVFDNQTKCSRGMCITHTKDCGNCLPYWNNAYAGQH